MCVVLCVVLFVFVGGSLFVVRRSLNAVLCLSCVFVCLLLHVCIIACCALGVCC